MTTTETTRGLFLAFELGWDKWVLAFATAAAEKPRIRRLKARDLLGLFEEIAKAKKRFGLPADAPVYSCYEAGRDGFWLHRCLTQHGITNVVVDPASIEVNRRAKRAKTDRLDAGKLVNHLCRYHGGERKLWAVVRVPDVADEDRRQLHRGLKDLQNHQTECSNRIKGLLAAVGLEAPVDARFRQRLADLRDWAGQPAPAGLQERVLQEYALWEAVHGQIRVVETARKHDLDSGQAPWLDKIRRLMCLKAIGVHSAWVFVQEFFGWRQIKNGKELGALAGLTPLPYDSGRTRRGQGISKAGNRHVRVMIVEIAWMWLRWQPQSALSQWHQRRFGSGNKRLRKVGIVALARKLLIALWRYLEHGELPAGAQEKDWRWRISGPVAAAQGAAAPA
jgi:transposase